MAYREEPSLEELIAGSINKKKSVKRNVIKATVKEQTKSFKLDIDYPVEIQYEDKMLTPPERLEYTNKRRMPIKHYGRLIFDMLDQLKTMPEGRERSALVQITAGQMYRSLTMWGMQAADKEKVASDLARFTDGVIQVLPKELKFETVQTTSSKQRKRKKK